jgi:hypothetical protein
VAGRCDFLRIFVAQFVEREPAVRGHLQCFVQQRAGWMAASLCGNAGGARRWRTARSRSRRGCAGAYRGHRVLQPATTAHMHVYVAGWRTAAARSARNVCNAAACRHRPARGAVRPPAMPGRRMREPTASTACSCRVSGAAAAALSGISSATHPSSPSSRSARVSRY